jgi:CRP-like cAMP-binding protein
MSSLVLPEEVIVNSEIKEFKKGDLLLQQGDLVNHFFYVLNGCLRSYIIDSRGKEHVVQFAPEDWIIADGGALFNSTPAQFNIDALENSTVRVVKISYKNNLSSDVNIDMNQKLLKRMIVLQKRIIQLLSATAEERYDDFNNTYPNLAKRLSQKMIASYLGITPESLSRVRKERVAKK